MVAPTPLPQHPPTVGAARLLGIVVDAAVGPPPAGHAAQLTWVTDAMSLELAADAGFNVGLSRARATAFAGYGGWGDLAQAVGMTRRPVRHRISIAHAASKELRATPPTDPVLAVLARSLQDIGGLIGGRPTDRGPVARALADALHAKVITDAAWEHVLVTALSAQVAWREAESDLGLSHGRLQYRVAQRPGRRRLGDLVALHPGSDAAVQLFTASSPVRASPKGWIC